VPVVIEICGSDCPLDHCPHRLPTASSFGPQRPATPISQVQSRRTPGEWREGGALWGLKAYLSFSKIGELVVLRVQSVVI
jgi:hypothetical protein